MSEKLYKVVKAVDIFDKDNPIPKRYLVFEHQNGNQIEVYFPEDRTTLFFRDELYDWYGHKVELSDDIVRILKPFGYAGCSYNQPQEKFLVATKNHRCALATLHHVRTVHLDSDTILGFKHGLLHDDFALAPILKCENWTFQEILDLSSTCFRQHFDTNGDYDVFVDVDSRDAIEKDCPSFKGYLKNSEKDPEISSIRFACRHTHNKLLKHRVIASREEALNSHGVFGGSNIVYVESNYLLGNLEISKHGEKITARSPIPDKYGNTRISTDSETIKHLALYDRSQLYWYYDPEP